GRTVGPAGRDTLNGGTPTVTRTGFVHGTFNQTAGSNVAAGLGVESPLTKGFTGTYTLSGGTLSTVNSEVIEGVFIQTGGSNFVGSTLTVGRSGGINGVGLYALGDGATLSVTGAEKLGHNS